MSPHQSFTHIPLQIGSELRIRNNGEVSVSNPSVEQSITEEAADAVLEYRFDANTGEHVLRLRERAPLRMQRGAGSNGDRAAR